MIIIQGVTYQIRYESVPELAPNAVSVVDLNADSMSQFYSIRRPSSIEIMVEEEPLPPTERFDSPFIGHRVLLPSGQQELVSSLRCIFSSCIRIACIRYRVVEIRSHWIEGLKTYSNFRKKYNFLGKNIIFRSKKTRYRKSVACKTSFLSKKSKFPKFWHQFSDF